jgi:hypothetical protein
LSTPNLMHEKSMTACSGNRVNPTMRLKISTKLINSAKLIAGLNLSMEASTLVVPLYHPDALKKIFSKTQLQTNEVTRLHEMSQDLVRMLGLDDIIA